MYIILIILFFILLAVWGFCFGKWIYTLLKSPKDKWEKENQLLKWGFMTIILGIILNIINLVIHIVSP